MDRIGYETISENDFQKIIHQGHAIVKLVDPLYCNSSRRIEMLVREAANNGILEPCQLCSALLKRISNSNFYNNVRHISVNATMNPWLAERLKTAYVPTVYLFRDGKPIAQRIGAPSDIYKLLFYFRKLNDRKVGMGLDNEGKPLMDVC